MRHGTPGSHGLGITPSMAIIGITRGMVITLHPGRKLIGTHVVAHQRGDVRFTVVDSRSRTISEHGTLQAACARSRWHSGTRFVYVEMTWPCECACWDGVKGELVTWAAAFETMSRHAVAR